MKLFSKFLYLASGFGVLGSLWLWILGALSGFSSNHVVCFATGGVPCTQTNNPYWLANNILWLAPLLIVLIFASWFLAMLILPKNLPEVLSGVLVLFLLGLVCYFALNMAAGNGL